MDKWHFYQSYRFITNLKISTKDMLMKKILAFTLFFTTLCNAATYQKFDMVATDFTSLNASSNNNDLATANNAMARINATMLMLLNDQHISDPYVIDLITSIEEISNYLNIIFNNTHADESLLLDAANNYLAMANILAQIAQIQSLEQATIQAINSTLTALTTIFDTKDKKASTKNNSYQSVITQAQSVLATIPTILATK